MVREAIVRELARDGQVYYVYNRVNQIEDVAAEIQKLVPDATAAVAHGQITSFNILSRLYIKKAKEVRLERPTRPRSWYSCMSWNIMRRWCGKPSCASLPGTGRYIMSITG